MCIWATLWQQSAKLVPLGHKPKTPQSLAGSKFPYGADGRNRTDDLLITSENYLVCI